MCMRTKDENKRVAIYHAAMKVVNTEGLANASMSKIAKAAGVSSSTLYVYFENKEDMLNKLYLMAKQESSEAIFQGFDPMMEVKAGFELYLRNLFRYMQANPVTFSFLEQFSPNIRPEIREAGLKYYAPVHALFARAVQQGIVKNYPMRLVKAFVSPPIESLVEAHHNQELDVNEDILEKAIDMAWQAVKYLPE